MRESLKQVQLEFATSLLHTNAETALLARLAGDVAKNRNRVAHYRDHLRHTWHRALASAYPVLHSLMGEAFFVALSREYGTADPSRSSDLNRFGSRMAELLEAWPPTATLRYLADVARLEWVLHRARYAADAVTRPSSRWTYATVEALENCSILFHPAVELVHTSTRAADRWRMFRSSGEKPALSDADHPQWSVVARVGWTPDVLVISENAFAMLTELRDGATIGDAHRSAVSRDASFDFDRHWHQWIRHGIVATADVRRSA
ncbi:DNA-binding domain-containing protein [Burkholderia latens]|uniref:DUF2063 domain-containing protein n=1 Tax=Burkholderia latens TaxID=488446 RepID=A0A6H9T0R4_9BURK|nr:DNA-binding domain-containing protein [Burkholderia latens]KAB0642240.1 DUF2063 domain-containing protein [Burkholderia latens]VWC03321.1 hypothetical protein BLA24064_04932 [Burkholderia latens]